MKILRIFLQAACVVIVSSIIAVTFNAVRAEGIPLVAADRAKTAANSDSDTGPVDLEGAKKLYDQGAVFIDARIRDDYARGHVRGAYNFFYADIKAQAKKILEQVSLDKTVVTYCSGEECHASDIVAQELQDLGYEKVRVFFAGWPAWKAAGYPQDSSGAAGEPIYKPMGSQ